MADHPVWLPGLQGKQKKGMLVDTAVIGAPRTHVWVRVRCPSYDCFHGQDSVWTKQLVKIIVQAQI